MLFLPSVAQSRKEDRYKSLKFIEKCSLVPYVCIHLGQAKPIYSMAMSIVALVITGVNTLAL